MKVSIVIPVYNAEKYIEECVESALNQTYHDIEVIAIDDGSTGKSLEILKKYQDKIKIIVKKNGGTATALNTGIKVMTGEWFKWLSADDVLYPNAIEELIVETKNVKDPQKTIFYSNFHYIDSKSNIIADFIEPNYNNLDNFDLNVILLDHFVGNGSTSLIHKSAFENHGLFDENLTFADDYEFWLRCCVLNNFSMHLIPKILVGYRIHLDQLTTKVKGKFHLQGKVIRKSILEKLHETDRQKYEIALKQYQHKNPIKRTKDSIDDFMLNHLPRSTSDKIVNIYRKIRRRDHIKKNFQDFI